MLKECSHTNNQYKYKYKCIILILYTMKVNKREWAQTDTIFIIGMIALVVVIVSVIVIQKLG